MSKMTDKADEHARSEESLDDKDAALEESELQDEQDQVIEDADANLKKHSTDSSK